jgi:hypothetical protein
MPPAPVPAPSRSSQKRNDDTLLYSCGFPARFQNVTKLFVTFSKTPAELLFMRLVSLLRWLKGKQCGATTEISTPPNVRAAYAPIVTALTISNEQIEHAISQFHQPSLSVLTKT